MAGNLTWSGARWWKFDLHTHTPASNDYGKGPNQAELAKRSPTEWLLDFMRAGIDCVAITDHNSGAWIDRLKHAVTELDSAKPVGYRPLHLFPGTEISVNGGVHVLAIFDATKDTSDIDSLLGAVGYSGTKGTSDGVTTKTFTEVVAAIAAVGGIAIPAHVDTEKGLFRSATGTTLEQAIACPSVFAFETVMPDETKPALVLEKGLKWTEVVGSDCHHPDGSTGQRFPGSHYTWIKMGRPTLDGLKLALLDGAISVQRHATNLEPNVHAKLVLRSLRVDDAQYMGRGNPLILPLSPWLTTIIGGRGCGKSTLVELLRTALDRRTELPRPLEGDLDRYFQASKGRNDTGLLTEKTALAVEYEKDGTSFRVTWRKDTGAHVMEELDENGAWKPIVGDVQQRFPARIYSQKQVFHLAKQPLALLAVVDDATQVERKTWDADWKEATNHYRSLRARVRELEGPLNEETALTGELDDIKRRLKVFEGAGYAPILKEYERRTRQQSKVDAWTKKWMNSGIAVRTLAGGLVPDGFEGPPFEAGDPADEDVAGRALQVKTALDAIRATLVEAATGIDERATNWQAEIGVSKWGLATSHARTAYEQLATNLDEEKAGRPQDFGTLVVRRQEIELRLTALQSRRIEASDVRKQAAETLKRVENLRQLLSARREAFLEATLKGNPHVRIRVVRYGASLEAEQAIRNLIHRESGFDPDIGEPMGDGLLGALYLNSNKGLCTEASLEGMRQFIRAVARNQPTGQTIHDARFGKHLQKMTAEDLDALDLWYPEDSLHVEYSPNGDGKDFRSIETGSPGQMTAALLAFLLSYSEQPLVLDQPEDDLDNQLIYGLIVNQIRQAKLRRQIIVVTHNPNIVVNGDAELVVALTVRSGGTHIDSQGSLQERSVRDTICKVMEGGRLAFEQRYRRIALETVH